MNPAFATSAFWRPYFTLEPHGLTENDLEAQLDVLSRDYPAPVKELTYEYFGRRKTTTYRVVEFSFFCGERFSLTIEYEPDTGGCSRNLFLVDAESGHRHQMGWWDMAQWHPYCLRAQELDLLLAFWSRYDPRWPAAETPLLLFCQFVGCMDDHELQTLSNRVNAALARVGVSGPPQGCEVPLRIPEDGYRWEEDPELGWVYTSDDYGCYSIRNRAHAGSDEGQFPFVEFRHAMAEIEFRLQRGT